MSDKEKWGEIEKFFSERFSDNEQMNIDSILFMIGIQELGKGKQKFSKDEKLNVMHIAVCRLMIPFGYYKFDKYDDQGWPHYNLLEELPNLKANEQQIFIRKAIIQYFEDENLF